MKKTIIFAMMAAVLGFTACSKEEPAQPETAQKGMVLRATVEQPADTKATFTDNEGVWHFDFEEGDIIKVTNREIGADKFYTFTYDGEKFVSEDAKPTTEATAWYANFPSNNVPLVGQSGEWNDIANKYVMTGSTTDNVTGEEGLSITMSPHVAILKILNLKDDININVKNSSSTWFSGYKAEKISIKDFYMLDPIYSDTEQTLLSATEKGTYYIAVPAGVQLAIKDGDTSIKSTGTNGLTAGKYYNLTIMEPTTGYAEVNPSAYITGNKVKWIQLWENGPKFAQFNVWATSATKCGGYFCWGYCMDMYEEPWTGETLGDNDTATNLWGSKWRMPTQTELAALINPENCNVEWIDGNTKKYNDIPITGLLCTGRGDYSSNSVFLPAAGYGDRDCVYEQSESGYYWSSTPAESIGANYMSFNSDGQYVSYGYRVYGYSVRAVLAE